MILTFSNPKFKKQILDGTKIHTIRKDNGNRWRAGRTIHFWKGNPRNKTKNPHQFWEGLCLSVEEIEIYRRHMNEWGIKIGSGKHSKLIHDYKKIELLANNDGLTLDEFKEFFLSDADEFKGKIIHWSSLRYTNFSRCIICHEPLTINEENIGLFICKKCDNELPF